MSKIQDARNKKANLTERQLKFLQDAVANNASAYEDAANRLNKNYSTVHDTLSDDVYDDRDTRVATQKKLYDIRADEARVDAFNRLFGSGQQKAAPSAYDDLQKYSDALFSTYRPFSNADDYTQYMNLLRYDTDAAQKQIDSLTEQKKNAPWLSKDRRDIGKQIDQLEDEIYRANQIQYPAKVSEYRSNSDFDLYAQRGAQMANPSMQDVFFHPTILGKKIGKQDVVNKVAFGREHADELLIGAANGTAADKEYDYYKYRSMTDDEVATYNYILAKYGTEEADKYLAAMDEELNAREGKGQAQRVGELGNAAELAYMFGSGMESAVQGVRQTFSPELLSTSPSAFGSQIVRESLADDGAGWQIAGDLAMSTGNMLPSIALSAMTGGAGPAVGAATMGLGVYGSTYNQARKDGLTERQASTYAGLVAAAEGGLQYLLGGIGKLGGKLTGNAVSKIVKNIDSAFLRISVSGALKAGGEGLEEGLQEILDPLFKGLATGEIDPEWFSTEDIAYSALLGFLSGGMLEGPSNLSTNVRTMSIGRGINQSDAARQELLDSALQFKDSENKSERSLYDLAYEMTEGKTHQNDFNVGDLAIAAQSTGVDVDAIRKKAFEDAASRTAQKSPVSDSARDAEKSDGAAPQVAGSGFAKSQTGIVETADGSMRVSNISINEVNDDGIILDVTEEDGSVVQMSFDDVEFDDDRADELFEAASMMDTNTAKAFVTGYDGSVPVSEYTLGFMEVMGAARNGAALDSIMANGINADVLSPAQRQSAYIAGQNAGRVVDASVSAASISRGGVVDRTSGLNKNQKRHMAAVEAFAKLIGRRIIIEDSITVLPDGARVSGHTNAYFNPNSNEYHIAKDGIAEAYMFFAIHENIHDIRSNNPSGYNKLKKVVFDVLGEERIADARKVQERLYPNESIDYIDEEIVANTVPAILNDPETAKMMAERVAKADIETRNAFEQLLNSISDMLHKAYEYLKGTKSWSQLHDVENNLEAISRIREAYFDALNFTIPEAEVVSMSEAKSAYESGAVVVNDEGVAVGVSEKNGDIKLSLSTYESDGRATLKDWLDKAVRAGDYTAKDAADIMRQMDTIFEICNNFKGKYAAFSAWSDAKVVLNEKGRPVFSVVRKNGDYSMNIDFSTVCKKRRMLDRVLRIMARRGVLDDFDMSQEQIVRINDIIKKHGFERAYDLCFVDAKRFRQAALADDFCEMYNDAVRSLIPAGRNIPIASFNFSHAGNVEAVVNGLDTIPNSELNFAQLKKTMRENGNKTVAYKIAQNLMSHPQDRRLVVRSDFMHSEGFENLTKENPRVMRLFNSKKGSGGPKSAFGDVQYLNDILSRKSWKPAAAYAVGGVRLQSFSDFIARLVFDYVQMIGDLAAKKLPAHAYTKEALFVKMFGLTGTKINMSLIPKVVEGGIAPGLDANGNYAFADESFDYETACRLQADPRYGKNVGTICVGVSSLHIWKLLADPNIRMVIPYHKSSLNPIVAAMNHIAAYKNYTDFQNTRYANGKKLSAEDARKVPEFNKRLHELGAKGDPVQVAREYVEFCEERGWLPKFDEFARLEDGSFNPNYYKLLTDFALYDESGTYCPQQAVTATFPNEKSAFGSMAALIEEGLEEDDAIEKRRDAEVDGVVDEIIDTLGEKNEWDMDNPSTFSYENLVKQKPMKIVSLPDIGPFFADGKIDKSEIKNAAMKNAEDNSSHFSAANHPIVENSYTRRNIEINGSSINHGLDGNFIRLLTNSRLSVALGELVRNAIPINSLVPKSGSKSSPYLMVAYAEDSQHEALAVLTIDKETNAVQNIEVSDVLHSLNGRTKKRTSSGAKPPRSAGTSPTNGTGATISIEQLLEIVNDLRPDILPKDIQNRFQTNAIAGYYSNKIRFSLSDTEKVNRANIRKVADLEKRLSAAKGQLKLTKGVEIDPARIKALAKKMLKEMSSQYSVDKFAANISNVFRHVANTSNPDMDYVIEALNSVSKAALLESSEKIEDDRLHDLRSYFKNSGSTYLTVKNQEAIRYEYGSLREFKKMLRGSGIKLTVNPERSRVNLDEVFVELSEMFPSLFASDTTENDQPSALVSAWKLVQPTVHNVYDDMNIDEAANDLTMELIAEYGDDLLAKPTFADKQKARFVAMQQKLKAEINTVREQTKAEYNKALEALIEMNDRNLASLEQRIAELEQEKSDLANMVAGRIQAEERRKRAAEIDAQREKYQAQIAELKSKANMDRLVQQARNAEAVHNVRERMKDTDIARGLRNRIRAKVKSLHSMLLNPTDQKHIPDNLEGAILDFCRLFTQTPGVLFTEKQLLRVSAYYDELASDVSSYDEDIADDLKKLGTTIGDKTLAELSNEELQKINDIVDHFKHMVSNENKLFRNGRRVEIKTIGENTLAEARSKGMFKRLAILSGQGISNMRKLIKDGNVTPIYFFKQMGGEMKKLYDDIRNGQDKWAVNMDAAKKFITETKERFAYDKWANKKDDTLQLKTERGDALTLTREQAMLIYATRKREIANKQQHAAHLESGGIVFEEKQREGKYVVDDKKAKPLTSDDIETIMGWLTEQQKQYADAMVGYMSNEMSDLGNEVSMRLFGIRKFREKYYIPYNTSEYYNFQRPGAPNDARLKHMSFTKRTVVNAKNPIVVSDFTEVCAGHIQSMCMYNAMTVPLDNMTRVLNYKTQTDDETTGESVRSAIASHYGDDTLRYIDQLIVDINGGVRSDSRDKALSKAISLFKKSAVVMSASVAIQQPASIGRATALIDIKHFVKTAGKKRDFELVKKYAPVAIVKQMGRFDTGTGLSATAWLMEGSETGFDKVKKKVDEIGGKAPEWMDQKTWSWIFNACVSEMQEKTQLKGEELLKAAAKRFRDVVDFTQVYDSVLARSANMRSNTSFMQMVTSFAAEPTLSYNLLMDAMVAAKTGEKGGKKYAARAVGAFILTTTLTAVLKSLVTAGRDKDEDESYIEKYVTAVTTNFMQDINPLRLIPVVRDCMTIFVDGFSVERADMSLASDLKDAFDKFTSESATPWEKWSALIGSVSAMAGIPAKNVIRDVESAINMIGSLSNEPTAQGIRLAFEEGLGINNSAQKRAERVIHAYLRGDTKEVTQTIADYRYTLSRDLTEQEANKKVESWLKKEIKAQYVDGNITPQEANRMLEELVHLTDTKDIFSLYKKWDYEKEGGDPDDAPTAYSDIYAIVRNKGDISSEMKNLVNAGYDEDDVRSRIQSQVASWFKGTAGDGHARISRADAKTMLLKYTDKGSEKVEKLLNEWQCYVTTGIDYNDIRSEYEKGNLTVSRVSDMLRLYGGYDAEDADAKARAWEFFKGNPEYDDISIEAVSKYNANAKPAGVSATVFAEAWEFKNDAEPQYNDNGKVVVSVQSQVWQYINNLPISKAQKDALHLCFYARSTLHKAPWN